MSDRDGEEFPGLRGRVKESSLPTLFSFACCYAKDAVSGAERRDINGNIELNKFTHVQGWNQTRF